MFEGFTEQYIPGAGTELFVRTAGRSGASAIVLLHGYPQTSAMWHLIAPQLAADYQIVCPDLRGYGRSGKPATDTEHLPYSKRAMAADIVEVMKTLGHDRFYIGAHDRGARVAHRLALDFPEKVIALSLLDIAPTREMYAAANTKFATAYWHWYFLIQPYPLPETMIGADPVAFWKMKCINQAKGENPFSQQALDEYLGLFNDKAAIHASCEDYRAAASIDIKHDDQDGKKKLQMPLQILWAKKGVIESCFDALALWRQRAVLVEGESLEATHYMAEEIPEEITLRMSTFFSSHL